MKKTKLTPIGAKEKLKSYYNFFESDFYQDGKEIRLNCKDNVGEKATDLYETLNLERKEEYIIGCDPYEQDSKSNSFGAELKVRVDGTFEVVKYEK